MEQSHRQLYYFYNENFKPTFVADSSNLQQGEGFTAEDLRQQRRMQEVLRPLGLDAKLQFKALMVFDFFRKHFEGLPVEDTAAGESCVYLLTDSPQSKKTYQNLITAFFGPENASAYLKNVVDLNQFIQMNAHVSPEFSNYFGGFTAEEVEDESDQM